MKFRQKFNSVKIAKIEANDSYKNWGYDLPIFFNTSRNPCSSYSCFVIQNSDLRVVDAQINIMLTLQEDLRMWWTCLHIVEVR